MKISDDTPHISVFQGPEQVAVYQAIAIKHGLQLWLKTGMKPNSRWTPTAMLNMAKQITGQPIKARAYQAAIDALDAWIKAEGAKRMQKQEAA